MAETNTILQSNYPPIKKKKEEKEKIIKKREKKRKKAGSWLCIFTSGNSYHFRRKKKRKKWQIYVESNSPHSQVWPNLRPVTSRSHGPPSWGQMRQRSNLIG